MSKILIAYLNIKYNIFCQFFVRNAFKNTFTSRTLHLSTKYISWLRSYAVLAKCYAVLRMILRRIKTLRNVMSPTPTSTTHDDGTN